MAYTITNHRLEGVDYHAAADHAGRFAPDHLRYIVLHYTAGAGFDGALATLTASDENPASAHLLVGIEGRVAQLVPFDTVAYHAGKSTWQGLSGLNAYSIGIEMVNPGYARAGITYSGVTLRAAHRSGGPERDWFLYPAAQVARVVELCAALCLAYPTIRGIMGHDDIAPGRKLDPGPAWQWPEFRAALAARGALPPLRIA